MKNSLSSMNTRLARRIAIYVILASTVITLFTSGVQIYSEYNREVGGIHQFLTQLEKTHVPEIASRIWVLDTDELKRTLSNLLSLPAVQYIAVYEGDILIEKAGNKTDKKIIKKIYPLIYSKDGIENKLGKVEVFASLDSVYDNLIRQAVVIIVSNTIKTFIISFVILFIFYKLVSRHLSHISQYTESYEPLNHAASLSLERTTHKRDELDVVVESINSMHRRLSDQLSEINKQQQYLSRTLTSIGDAVITTDNKGNITLMNPVAEDLTGWTNKEAQGYPIKTVFNIVDATTRKTIANPIDKVLKYGETVYLSNHTTLISKNSEEYHIADSAAPILDDEKNILGMVLVFNNVTEQYRLRQAIAESEKKYQTLAKAAPVGIYLTDKDGNCVYVNETWCEITGLSFEDAVKDGWTKSLHDDDRERVFSAWDKATKEDNLFKLEYRFQILNKTRWVLGQAIPSKNDDGEITGFVGTITDITERKEAEYALSQSQKMDALGKLTGGVAHDYNNMLSVVMGFSEILEDTLKDQPELAKIANEIYRAGQRGAKLTQKLLAFSRHKDSNAEKVNINELLLSEKDMLEKTLTARVKLIFHLDEDIWPAYLDKNDFENAVVNICINAMHAMEAQGTITIQTDNVEITEIDSQHYSVGPGDYILLNISDTGKGIHDDIKERIFDPFFSTKGELGTGLGLSQVYGFINRSGGAIKVYSENGLGTCLSLYFPRLFDVENSKDIQNTSQVLNKDITGTESILIVDDEPALLKLLSEVLIKNGYHVMCAESGLQALTILENESVDLLLSDVIMPEMDGYQLAAVVEEKYPQIKIQLASGFTDERHANMTNESLHKKMIKKPYKLQFILNRVREILDS